MRQFAGLRRLRILQQRAGRGHGRLQPFGAEAGQRSDFELVAEQAAGRVEFEIPVGLAGAGDINAEIGRPAFRVKDFGRADALQRRRNLLCRHFEQHELAAGQVQAGDAGGIAVGGHGEQPDVALVVDQRRVGQRSRRDDARHGALDRPLAGCRIADLLTDHCRFAELDQPRQIGLQRMERHAAHADRDASRLAAGGQRDVEKARRLLGIVVEQLVEIAHPVEEQRIRMVGLERQVLNHHRRMLGAVGGLAHGYWGGQKGRILAGLGQAA